MNINGLKLAKVLGMLLSIGGMIVTSAVSSRENEKILDKLLDKRLQK